MNLTYTCIFGNGHGPAKFSQGENVYCGLVRSMQVERSQLAILQPKFLKKYVYDGFLSVPEAARSKA